MLDKTTALDSGNSQCVCWSACSRAPLRDRLIKVLDKRALNQLDNLLQSPISLGVLAIMLSTAWTGPLISSHIAL